MKFQIIAGSHYENGKLYRKGQVIDSPYPLDKMFPHKIRRVEPKEKAKETGGVEEKAVPKKTIKVTNK